MRDIDDLSATGRRTVRTVRGALTGSDRVDIAEDEWVSAQSDILLHARQHTLGGEIEYRVTSFCDSGSDAALFTVPAGYSLIDLAE